MAIEKIVVQDKSKASEDISEVDNRNVSDNYKHIPLEMIRESLDEKRLPLVNIALNLTSDFNKSSIVRTANCFLGSEVYLVGKRRYDKRGTAGTHHYEHIYHSPEAKEVIDHLKDRGYTVFAVDNTDELAPEVVYSVDLPEKTAFLFGEEGTGIPVEIAKLCDKAVYIPQSGSARSLNVAVASGVMMSEYMRRHRWQIE